MDNEKEGRANQTIARFSSYEEEIEIIENIAGDWDINDDIDMRSYLNQRKCAIYYGAQIAVDQTIETYTNKLYEIETLILSEREKQAELEKRTAIKEENQETLIKEAIKDENSDIRNLLVSIEVRKDLLKISEGLKQSIDFLKDIDVYRDGLPNLKKQDHTSEVEQELKDTAKNDKITEEVPSNEQEISQGDTFLIVPKTEGRLDFIKRAWNHIKEKFTKKSKEREIATSKHKKTEGKPKENSIRERLGGYNKSQNEFEKNAMAAVEKHSLFNSEPTKKEDQQYGK